MSEQINELSKKTLKSYVSKAKKSLDNDAHRSGYKNDAERSKRHPDDDYYGVAKKRRAGIKTASNKLKEESELEEKMKFDDEDGAEHSEKKSKVKKFKDRKAARKLKDGMMEAIDILNAVKEEKPTEAASVFDKLIRDKIIDAVTAKKIEIANGLAGAEVEESVDPEDEDFDPDFDEDDIDLDDLDIDEELTEEQLAWIAENITEEEFEQLDEISKKTLGSYIKKATASARNANRAIGRRDQGDTWRNDDPYRIKDPKQRGYHIYNLKKSEKREKGIAKAADKLTKEEFEQIDELSKKTLGSYINKARSQESEGWYKQGNRSADSKDIKTTVKRNVGITKAVQKLTKESEDLQELSKKTLGNYIKKASDSVDRNSWKSGYFGRGIEPADNNAAVRTQSKSDKRLRGIKKATDKITKEEVSE